MQLLRADQAPAPLSEALFAAAAERYAEFAPQAGPPGHSFAVDCNGLMAALSDENVVVVQG